MTTDQIARVGMFALEWHRLQVIAKRLKEERKAAFKKCEGITNHCPEHERPRIPCWKMDDDFEWCDYCLEGDKISQKFREASKRAGIALWRFRHYIKSLDKKEERGG